MRKKPVSTATTMALTLLICLFCVFPFMWMLSTSFKPSQEVFSLNPTFIPYNPTIEGYVAMLTEQGRVVNFMRWARNSFFVALYTTIAGLVVASLGGYGISRYRFRGRASLGYIILVTQMLPGSLLIIPLFMILSTYNLLDSFLGLVITYVTFAVPFCTWMMKGFFDAVPTSLDESARIDGASELSIFMRVILPLTRPGIAVTALFCFIVG